MKMDTLSNFFETNIFLYLYIDSIIVEMIAVMDV